MCGRPEDLEGASKIHAYYSMYCIHHIKREGVALNSIPRHSVVGRQRGLRDESLAGMSMIDLTLEDETEEELSIPDVLPSQNKYIDVSRGFVSADHSDRGRNGAPDADTASPTAGTHSDIMNALKSSLNGKYINYVAKM